MSIRLVDAEGVEVESGFRSHAEAARAWQECYSPRALWIDDSGDRWDAEDTFEELGLGRYDR